MLPTIRTFRRKEISKRPIAEIQGDRYERVERAALVASFVGDGECCCLRRTLTISAAHHVASLRSRYWTVNVMSDESSIGSKVPRVIDHSCDSLTESCEQFYSALTIRDFHECWTFERFTARRITRTSFLLLRLERCTRASAEKRNRP